MGSLIEIWIGENDYFIASVASTFIEFTKDAIYLEDGDMASIRTDRDIAIHTIKTNEPVSLDIQDLKMNMEAIEKGGYEHTMLKEHAEQSTYLRHAMRNSPLVDEGLMKMAEK